MKTQRINQTVTVTSVRFGRSFEPIPQRIEFGGRTINFIDEGIRMSVKSGQQFTRLFNMSDGRSQFNLRQGAGEGSWQLISISQ